MTRDERSRDAAAGACGAAAGADDVVEGNLDVPGKKITGPVEGSLDQCPVRIDPLIGGDVDCLINISFSGDVVVLFEVEPAGTEYLRVTEIQDPTIENVEVNMEVASGGTLCDILVDNKDLIIEEFINQLEEQTRDLVIQLREQLVGSYICK